MFEVLRPLFEAEAAQRGRQNLELIRAAQVRNKVLWAWFLAATVLAFCIILASIAVRERHGSAWLWCGVLLSLALITCSEHLRHNLSFMSRQAQNARRFAAGIQLKNQADFLRWHAWTTYVFVIAPVVFAGVWLALHSSGFSKPGTAAYVAYADVLKQLSALAGALLAAQIALFNFMFGQLLGKYSSTIAVAVIEHRAVQCLRGASLGLLVLFYGFFFWGFPDSLLTLKVLLIVPLAASAALTIWVVNSGVRVDRAIVYAGYESAERLKRSLKSPILTPTRFWNAMAVLALDWRRPERMAVTVPPEGGAAQATSLVTGIFNAIHKSIQENQHEILLASLQALFRLVDAWVDRRKEYYGSTDQFLSYVNDQLAGVLKAAARSPNEYMVMNTVMVTGLIASRALEVGRGPHPIQPGCPESHPYFSHWQGLISEAFELTHGLMRSTAATEAITQLRNLAKTAVDLSYIGNVSLSFPSELERIYTICLRKRDAYHVTLGGECVTAIMNVWRYCLANRQIRSSEITKQMGKSVLQMALAFQAVERLASFNLEDPITSVVSKINEDRFTFQDLAIVLVSTPIKEDWQRRDAIASLRQLLGTVRELAKDAAKRDVSFANNYAEVLYEFALVIMGAIPADWSAPGPNEQSRIGSRGADVRELFDTELGEILTEIIPLYYRAEKMVHDWEQPLFAVIGISAAVFAESGRESAKALAVSGISAYLDLIAAGQAEEHKVIREDAWDYLQLTSVWLRSLLGETALADQTVEMVANGRPFSFGPFPPLSGKQGWGAYGYPNVWVTNSDFFLPNPINIQASLRQPMWEAMKRWQDLLMVPNHLQDTYDRIQKIRDPIRERLAARRKEEQRKRSNRQPREKAPSERDEHEDG